MRMKLLLCLSPPPLIRIMNDYRVYNFLFLGILLGIYKALYVIKLFTAFPFGHASGRASTRLETKPLRATIASRYLPSHDTSSF
jgi:hypothetical protein